MEAARQVSYLFVPEGLSVRFAGAKVWRTVDTDLEAERIFILTGK